MRLHHRTSKVEAKEPTTFSRQRAETMIPVPMEAYMDKQVTTARLEEMATRNFGAF